MEMKMRPLNPLKNAIESIAANARQSCASAVFGLITVAGLASRAYCSAINKPTRPSMYDFAPGVPDPERGQRQRQWRKPCRRWPSPTFGPLAGAIENQAVLYRSGLYRCARIAPLFASPLEHAARPTGQQRMRELLGQRRVVLTAREGISP